MAIICEFGTASEQAQYGFRMTGTITGTDARVLAQYPGTNVRLVRGAMIHGADDEYEFAVMTSPLAACTCGHPARPAAQQARGRWVVTCSRNGCPAQAQMATKRLCVERWNEMSCARG